jgi:alpha-N-acetylglucosamine transferase
VAAGYFLSLGTLEERMTVTEKRLPESTKVWTTLITNTQYLPGLLTLEYSLRKVGSKYPLVALYTDTFEEEGHIALDARGIYKMRIEYLLPSAHKDYSKEVRFYDCWSKLQPFSLTIFDRVVQLDSDMVVLQNMDELMDIPLNAETGVFAASHACVCNPYKKPHYPKDWIPENCAYTEYKTIKPIPGDEDNGHVYGPSPTFGLGICNGGLQVVEPRHEYYAKILEALQMPSKTEHYEFADQSLLSDVFGGRWVPLSYKYNALKTLRNIHSQIWDDNEVKNVHYIISPKPWDVRDKADRESFDDTDTFKFWFPIDDERRADEKAKGIADRF